MDRRQFLQGAAATGVIANSLIGCAHSDGFEAPIMPRGSGKAIIIGAGMSGLSAAHYLSQAGVDCTVLEARDRVGGRIFTNTDWGTPIDLGAGWIHGEKNNPVYDLAEAEGVRLSKTNFSNVTCIDSDTGEGEWIRLVRASMKVGGFIKNANARAAGESMGDLITAKTAGASPVMKRVYNGVRSALGANFGSDDLSDIDLFESGLTRTMDGSDWRFPDGYGALPEALASKLNVVQGKPVTHIEWGNPVVRVHTANEIFEADFLVLSVPLAVLKSAEISFSPPLPEPHQKAIDELEFGLSEKLIMEFDEVFWPAKKDVIIRASSSNDRVLFFNNHYPVSGKKFLTSRILGTHVPAFLETSDAAAANASMDALRSIFGAGLPEPKRIIRSNWLGDPYSAGSYSTKRVGVSSFEHRTVLSSPVARNFTLAGEHTSPRYPSTVHGAYLTGLQAAMSLLSA